jgi:pimeloyl-ACP methyl ester carboxylesterase
MGDLGGVRVPTLVIGGEDDDLTPPKYARYLVEHIENARLVLLEDAGHMLPFERHDTLAGLLHDYVKELAPAPRSDDARP